ncbi:leucine-rich repeat transmembrane protein FLRT3-like isoform X1 [Apostichopus japonicus]|uniref:leucine-rich repeat transmembrane protein FLRT3-like isoform X1 n=1 Tax=Stichopus japonicus TaxID=307972 RepID=UPI003AB8ECC2
MKGYCIYILVLATYTNCLEPCPKECYCPGWRIFQCDGNLMNITKFPVLEHLDVGNLIIINTDISSLTSGEVILPFFPNLIAVALKFCNIRSINNLIFNATREVESLDIAYNYLTSVPVQSFQVLTQLTILDLSGNMITQVEAFSFSCCDKLMFIQLRENLITKARYEATDGLVELQTLQLSNNVFESFPFPTENEITFFVKSLHLVSNNILKLNVAVPTKFPTCSHLDLSSNYLIALDDYGLHGFPLLETLRAPRNNISFVGKSLFGDEPHGLQALVLHENDIREIPSMLLTRLPNLTTLSLAKNNISNIHNFAFEHNSYLKYINLDENNIHTCSPLALVGLDNLDTLRISFNKLSLLPIDFFQVNHDFGLYLRGNNWGCDCSMKFLYDWFLKTRFFHYHVDCDTPLELKGKNLLELELKDFCTDGDVSTQSMAASTVLNTRMFVLQTELIGILFMVLVIVTIVLCLFKWSSRNN